MRSLGAGLLFVLLLSPCATALLVPDHAFSGELLAPAAGQENAGQGLSLLTGRVDVAGTETGAFSASGTRDVHVTGVGRLEAIPTLDGKPVGLPQLFQDVDIT